MQASSQNVRRSSIAQEDWELIDEHSSSSSSSSSPELPPLESIQDDEDLNITLEFDTTRESSGSSELSLNNNQIEHDLRESEALSFMKKDEKENHKEKEGISILFYI